jgi:hypothetical protein
VSWRDCDRCGGQGGWVTIEPEPGFHFEWDEDDEWQERDPAIVRDGYGRDVIEAAKLAATFDRIERALNALEGQVR